VSAQKSDAEGTRVGLLVRDPGSLYAFWHLEEQARDALRSGHGDRAASLARVTLRLEEGNRTRDVIPPLGADAHYLATERPGEPARVELGWTLPSGRFCSLARSESVSVPRRGASAFTSRVTLRFPAERDSARRLHRLEVRRVKAQPTVAEPPPAAGGSDAFRPARRNADEAPGPGGGSDAFTPPGGPARR
jgi:hypothetical protein